PSCTINWGDSNSDPGTISSGTCSFSGNHTYTSTGSKNVTVSVTKDNGPGGTGTSSATTVTVKVTPSFSNLSSPTISYGDTPTTLSGTIKAGSQIPTGSVSITLNGVPQSAAINAATGNFSSGFATGAL